MWDNWASHLVRLKKLCVYALCVSQSSSQWQVLLIALLEVFHVLMISYVMMDNNDKMIMLAKNQMKKKESKHNNNMKMMMMMMKKTSTSTVDDPKIVKTQFRFCRVFVLIGLYSCVHTLYVYI